MGLFDLQISRKPNNYPELQVFIEAIQNAHWTVREFSFKSDYAQFQKLSPQEQQVVVRAVSAISQIEVAVKQFWGKLGDNLPHPATTDIGYVLAANEVIHNEAYEKLLVVLGLTDMFEKNLQEGVIADRVKYLRKYTERVYKDDKKQYVYAICLFSLFVENVSLFSQFYTLMHFNRFDNVLKDTAQQIQYTRQEENLHAQVGIYLINKLREEYPELFDAELETRIREECAAALEAEGQVVDWFLGDYTREKLSAPILRAYIKSRINESMKQIGFKPLAVSEEEKLLVRATLWMEEETIGQSNTDFFHKRPIEYSKGGRSFDAGDIFS